MIHTSKNTALALLLGLALAGCSYASHLDRVSYSAGDAVKANLARETINPSKKSMNDTSGLGQDGNMPIIDVIVKDPLPGQE